MILEKVYWIISIINVLCFYVLMLISNLAINLPVNTQVVYIAVVLPEGINSSF